MASRPLAARDGRIVLSARVAMREVRGKWTQLEHAHVAGSLYPHIMLAGGDESMAPETVNLRNEGFLNAKEVSGISSRWRLGVGIFCAASRP